MLAAFLVSVMAAKGHSEGAESPDYRPASGGGGRKWLVHKKRARNETSVRPRPTHFLSVRIDNPLIWEKVASVQRGIIEEHAHLEDAAIPVQDLHLTLFVATLREDDGTLERAKETLKGCRDILQENGLAVTTPGQCQMSRDTVGNEESYGHHSAASCDTTDDNEEDMSRGAVDDAPPSLPSQQNVVGLPEQIPLTLAFGELGTFRDKVLYARLVEDEQAARFRRLASSMYARFSRAQLLAANTPRTDKSNDDHDDDQNNNSDINRDQNETIVFDFEPHLTIMKTSKLKDRKTSIPPGSYAGYIDCRFGCHAPTAIELSSMQEKEKTPDTPEGWESRSYYKCEQRLALPSVRHGNST